MTLEEEQEERRNPQPTPGEEGWSPEKEYEWYGQARQRMNQSIVKVRALLSQVKAEEEEQAFVIRSCAEVQNLLAQIADNTRDTRCKEEAERATWSVGLIEQRTESNYQAGASSGIARALAILEEPLTDE